MKEERHCATCANWMPKASETAEGTESPLSNNVGECHRYAPRPLILERKAATDAQLVWPKTRAEDVCGEWYYGGLRLQKQAQGTPLEPEQQDPPTLLAASDPGSAAPPRRSIT